MKDRMLLDAHDDIEIARRAAAPSGIAFTGQPNALTVAGSRFNSHFKWLGAIHQPFTMAGWTRCSGHTGASTSRALHIEFHSSRGLGDLAGPLTFRASSCSAN